MRWSMALPILLALVFVAALAPLVSPVVAPAVAQAPDGGGRNQIVTTGNGVVTLPPDQATVVLGAQAQQATAAAAMAEVNRTVTQILARWQQLGIPKSDIRTLGVQVFPVYTNPREGAQQISGYRAVSTLSATLNTLNQVGPALDAGIAAGANVVQGITFGLRDPSAARTEALTTAVREARQKADAIAAAAGLRIRSIEGVTEGGVSVQPREFRTAQAAGVPTPIEPGTVIVTAQVTVVFSY